MPDFNEGWTEILIALAARQLLAWGVLKSSGAASEELTQLHRRYIEYIKKADEKIKTHEYLRIVRGFYEIEQGYFTNRI
jgi:hypothetical protein